MNLGSPDSTEVKDVRTYLNEFLMDERVIDKPFLYRSILVKGIITPLRAPRSAKAYKSIWTEAGSPLIVISKQLQAKVQNEMDEPVHIAMRYGNPSGEFAIDKINKENPELEELILLPLYPHYAMSSYETAVEQIKEIHLKKKYKFKLITIKPFYDNALFIHALAESIRPYIQEDYDKILFSYHGIPERHVKKTDVTGNHCLQVKDCCSIPSSAHAFCYRHQTKKTTELVVEKLHIPLEKVEQTFQSRLGRDPWLTPYTAKRLEELPGEGIKKLLVVCPAFVSDCLETLEEIAEEGKQSFLESGGETFTAIPCMNIQPLWISAITTWLKDYMAGKSEMIIT